jgi:hypothetical protein
VIILLVGYIFELSQRPSTTALVALGCHRALGGWTLGEGLANLVLSIYWGHLYGLIGVALGTTVPLVAVKLTLQPWYTLGKLGISAREYLQTSLIRPVLVCLLFLGSARWMMSSQLSAGFLELSFTVAWQALLFCVITWVIGLNPVDRIQVRDRCRAISSRLKLIEPAEPKSAVVERSEDLVNVG